MLEVAVISDLESAARLLTEALGQIPALPAVPQDIARVRDKVRASRDKIQAIISSRDVSPDMHLALEAMVKPAASHGEIHFSKALEACLRLIDYTRPEHYHTAKVAEELVLLEQLIIQIRDRILSLLGDSSRRTGSKRQYPSFFWALAVGVGEYTHPRFTNLPATVRDAQAVARVLTDPNRCGYAPGQVRLLTGEQASGAGIRAALRQLVGETDADSTVFIYFSGHGGRAYEGSRWRVYLCPREADPDDLARTAISGEEFSDLLAAIPARKMLVVLDACHAGGAAELKAADGTVLWKAGLPESYYEVLAQGSGRVILASSKEDQLSYLRGELSLFTHHLVQALSGGAAVRNDGLIRVLDVFHYVNEAVSREKPGKQVPVLKVKDLDLNFPIALDRGGKGGVAVNREPDISAIRDMTSETALGGPRQERALLEEPMTEIAAICEQIVHDPIAGAKALSDFLATRPEWAAKRTDVDANRSRLESIQYELDLYGPDPSRQAAKNQTVHFLIKMCQTIEKELASGGSPSVAPISDPYEMRAWQLGDHIAQDLALLKEYEDALRYEDDPRRRAKYRLEIERLRASLAQYRQEYDDLRARVTGTPSAAMHEVAVRLQEMDAKLDTLLVQAARREDVADMRRALLERYEAGERNIVVAVSETLDRKQIATVEAVLGALEEGRIAEAEIAETLGILREMLANVEQRLVSLPLQTQVAEIVSNPELDVKHKLKVTLPIIPLLLSYEGEIGLGMRANLEEIWQRLVGKAKKTDSSCSSRGNS